MEQPAARVDYARSIMRLAFRQFGAGPCPLVLLHGLFGNSLTWKTFSQRLVQEFPKWTVFAPDARNHGDSPASSQLSMEDMANDLKEFIDEHSLVNPTIMGHSMGGKVAINFVCQNPAICRNLVIVDILPRSTYGAEFFPKYVELMKQLQQRKPSSLREADNFLSSYEPNPMTRASLLANLKLVKTETHEIFQYTCNLDAFSQYLGNFFAFPPGCQNRLPVGGNFPVALVLGRQSVFLPRDPKVGGLRGEIDLFERTFFPNRVQTIWIEGAGHFPHIEKPDLFYERTKAFLL